MSAIGTVRITATFNYAFTPNSIENLVRSALANDNWGEPISLTSLQLNGQTIVYVILYVYGTLDSVQIIQEFRATMSLHDWGYTLTDVIANVSPYGGQVGGGLGGGVNIGGSSIGGNLGGGVHIGGGNHNNNPATIVTGPPVQNSGDGCPNGYHDVGGWCFPTLGGIPVENPTSEHGTDTSGNGFSDSVNNFAKGVGLSVSALAMLGLLAFAVIKGRD